MLPVAGEARAIEGLVVSTVKDIELEFVLELLLASTAIAVTVIEPCGKVVVVTEQSTDVTLVEFGVQDIVVFKLLIKEPLQCAFGNKSIIKICQE